MHPFRTALVLSALLAATPVAVIAQASNIIERSVEDYVDQIENPCNGELVQLIGTISVTTRRTVDANGVVHLASNTVPSIRGEGPSGDYNVVGVHHVRDKFIDFEAFPENVNFKDDFHMISHGQGREFPVHTERTLHHRCRRDGESGIHARLGEVHGLTQPLESPCTLSRFSMVWRLTG